MCVYVCVRACVYVYAFVHYRRIFSNFLRRHIRELQLGIYANSVRRQNVLLLVIYMCVVCSNKRDT